jgi:NAD-dependent deacetylase
LYILLGRQRWVVLDDGILQAVALIRETKKAHGKVVVLTGAGVSTSSGIPDYTSGAWLPVGVPVSDYSFLNFQTSDRCRTLYWQACQSFRDVVAKALPNQGHKALAFLERQGWVDAIVTQNVDGLHQLGGSHKVTELHGTIHHVHCLACTWKGEWTDPVDPVPCPLCGGLTKPAVIALGENIVLSVWAEASSYFLGSSLVIVIGSQLTITTTATLAAEARQKNARFIFITLGEVGIPVFDGDVFLAQNAEVALPGITKLLEG